MSKKKPAKPVYFMTLIIINYSFPDMRKSFFGTY